MADCFRLKKKRKCRGCPCQGLWISRLFSKMKRINGLEVNRGTIQDHGIFISQRVTGGNFSDNFWRCSVSFSQSSHFTLPSTGFRSNPGNLSIDHNFRVAEEEYCEFSHSDTLLYWHWNMVQTPGNLVSCVLCFTLSRRVVCWYFESSVLSYTQSHLFSYPVTINHNLIIDQTWPIQRPMSPHAHHTIWLLLTLTVMAMMAVISVKTGQHHNI